MTDAHRNDAPASVPAVPFAELSALILRLYEEDQISAEGVFSLSQLLRKYNGQYL